jgi:hypothetical protein
MARDLTAPNTSPIFPAVPVMGIASLVAATGLTTRSNITGVAGLTQVLTTSNYGTRIDNVTIKAQGQITNATNVFLWIYNGTTSYLYDEFDVTTSTIVGNTTDSVFLSKNYTNLVLPPAYSLYISETVQANLNVFVAGGQY